MIIPLLIGLCWATWGWASMSLRFAAFKGLRLAWGGLHWGGGGGGCRGWWGRTGGAISGGECWSVVEANLQLWFVGVWCSWVVGALICSNWRELGWGWRSVEGRGGWAGGGGWGLWSCEPPPKEEEEDWGWVGVELKVGGVGVVRGGEEAPRANWVFLQK